ncbi:hypothetical protein HZ500_000827 [Salmonella enterica]|nr:hypothetical protein [Salmonella enterica]ECE0793439.1 hypothetical protein [Salmonella enterica subsp. diarizonae]ECF2145116.1 hypothetical protein [Salmonella enterica subsp. enterica serovar Newport]EDW2059391.1 hypothetical protein [Salmonella enterica subsp. enterica serovar Oslo]EBE9034085.1 hypothetical protein [Salmonella enterica]
MTLDTVYNDIRESLGKLCGIEIRPLPDIDSVNKGVAKKDIDEQYIIASIAEELTHFYSTIHERQKQRVLPLSFKDSLSIAIYEKTQQLTDPSQMSVALVLALISSHSDAITLGDQSLIAQWRSESSPSLLAMSGKTKSLSEVHWHDLPSELFGDLAGR